jgi:hypothetical protein
MRSTIKHFSFKGKEKKENKPQETGSNQHPLKLWKETSMSHLDITICSQRKENMA